jgi:MFS family permease
VSKVDWAPVAWVHSLNERLPCQILGSICVTHHILKGLVAGGGDEGLIGKPVEFLLAAQHVPAHQLQGLVALGGFAPWVLKPILGALSDSVPIFGYRRNPYMLIITGFSAIAIINLGTGYVTTIAAIIACLFFASLQIAGCTLLVDAKRSEVAKSHPALGPELVTFTEVGMNCCIIASALLVGPLINYAGPRVPYYLAFPLVLLAFIPVVGNWLGDERLPPGERAPNLRAMRKNPWLFGLGLSLLPLLCILAFASLIGIGHHQLAGVAALASLLVVGGYTMLIRKEISGPVVFYFIFRCLNLQLNGALFYFFTNRPEAFPEGPHFSPVFYVTAMTSFAIMGRMFGFWTAKDLFANWHYPDVLYVTMPLVALTQLSMVPVLLRWNLHVGIPDKLWVLVSIFFDMAARGWRHFPFSVMLLQATPRGLEASSLALNTGAANMGITLSVFFGGYALSLLGVQPAGHPGESHTFDNLWKAQVAAALLPLLCLPLMPMLMPRRRQNQTLILDHPESATHGAPIQRYFRTE